MKKVSAKEQKRKAYEEYLQKEGVLTFEHFQKAAMERVLQEAVESEVDVFLGRKRYEDTTQPAEFRGYRNGSYERTIKSAEDVYHVQHPHLRKTKFVSRILKCFKGIHEGLRRLSVEMYVRGYRPATLNKR